MGIKQEYRLGDRFIVELTEIRAEKEEETRYGVQLGEVIMWLSKEELSDMTYMPVYMTTGEVQTADYGEKRFREGFDAGFEQAKIYVKCALGIKDEQHGYERAKEIVIKALEQDEA